MNILLIAPTTEQTSGWGTFAHNVQAGLKKNGHRVTMVTVKDGLSQPLSVLASLLALGKTARTISKAIKKEKPDVIHILVEPYALAMPLVEKMTTTPPWVMNFHGTYGVVPHHTHLRRILMRSALRSCGGILVCSNFTLQQVLQTLRDTKSEDLAKEVESKAVRFRLGIDLPNYHARTLSTAPTKHVLFVGELKPRKGVKELVEGFLRYVVEGSPPAHLHLVGSYNANNPYITEIQELIRSQGSEEKVTFHGRIEEQALSGLYEQADAFAMLSKKVGDDFEGYGLVFLEANARGIPTLSARQSGGSEAVKDGETGFVVDHDDSNQVAQALSRLLNESIITSEACRNWAEEHNIEQQTQSCEQLYTRVTEK